MLIDRKTNAFTQNQAHPAGLAAAKTLTQYFYPARLTYFGGPVLPTVVQHNVYLNSANGAPWGNPANFEADLNTSDFVHIVDQYVGTSANNRYPVGSSLSVLMPINGPLYQRDINAIVRTAAVRLHATGGRNLMHIFLPKGVDTCLDAQNCYSPDNESTFTFCGYHSYVTLPGVGEALFTVEPYQAIPGCGVDFSGVAPANNVLMDGTASVLSHEFFETVTDPVPDSGWAAETSWNEQGSEIGDVCQGPFATNTFSGHKFTTQLEYSDTYEACVNGI